MGAAHLVSSLLVKMGPPKKELLLPHWAPNPEGTHQTTASFLLYF